MNQSWWKILSVILMIYIVVAGLLGPIPNMSASVLDHTVRSLYFHVPMWFCMTIFLTVSMAYSVMYLNKPSEKLDEIAVEMANTGFVLGILGLITGSIWARFTWGYWWDTDEIKLNCAAVAELIYGAYFVLRGSLDDDQKKARISAVYNIFAFAVLIPLLFIIPRQNASVHPGSGGNPGFNKYDLDSNMRMVFYPAMLAWFFLTAWITTLRIRMRRVQSQVQEV